VTVEVVSKAVFNTQSSPIKTGLKHISLANLRFKKSGIALEFHLILYVSFIFWSGDGLTP
jgi:hypothetical protein